MIYLRKKQFYSCAKWQRKTPNRNKNFSSFIGELLSICLIWSDFVVQPFYFSRFSLTCRSFERKMSSGILSFCLAKFIFDALKSCLKFTGNSSYSMNLYYNRLKYFSQSCGHMTSSVCVFIQLCTRTYVRVLFSNHQLYMRMLLSDSFFNNVGDRWVPEKRTNIVWRDREWILECPILFSEYRKIDCEVSSGFLYTLSWISDAFLSLCSNWVIRYACTFQTMYFQNVLLSKSAPHRRSVKKLHIKKPAI